ncbi:MAG TPA: hypothetical protein VHB46_17850 [Burkholderiales bacterium]|nr:hypothetical protein [Burkholderiales bacterium]
MSFAEDLANLNAYYFFKEFVYSANTFAPAPGEEVELADSLMWLGDTLIAFQLKERAAVQDATIETEKRWFEQKILRKGTHQVRDTVKYLGANPEISLKNHRGDTLQLSFEKIKQFHKLVVYHPHALLPIDYRWIKHHRSKTAGIIHIISSEDYLGIVQTMATPAEVAEYLDFREILIDRWGNEIHELPEQALAGQFLRGAFDEKPDARFIEFLQRLRDDANEWDMSGVISVFPAKVTPGGEPADYYPIVQEMAALKRTELCEFKKRFQLSVEKAKADAFTIPYRMATPRTGCGFAFIPLTADAVEHKRNALINITCALKYEQRLDKCIGIAISNDPKGWVMVDWLYMEHAWQANAELDQLLAENNPFREAKVRELPGYDFGE